MSSGVVDEFGDLSIPKDPCMASIYIYLHLG